MLGLIYLIIPSLYTDPAAGASDDWFYGGANARFSYTIELRDMGSYGFVLPDTLILPTAEENFAGRLLLSVLTCPSYMN